MASRRTFSIPRAIGGARPKFEPKSKSWLPKETILVARGRVQNHRDNRYSVIQTSSALLRVWWAGGLLPPSVFVGAAVNFIGRITTAQEGKFFRVVDALPLEMNYREAMRPVIRYLYQFAEDPREWLEKEALDRIMGE